MTEDRGPIVGGVRVTNKNEFVIRDRFDGVPFTFEPGKSVTIPPDAANHIFGWRHHGDDEAPEHATNDMLVYCQKRHGWNTPDIIKSGNHLKWFKAIEFKPVRFRMVEMSDEDEAPEELPNPIQKPGARRAGA